MIRFREWWKAQGFEDRACPYTKFAIAKMAWEKAKEENVSLRDRLLCEIASEEQDVLRLTHPHNQVKGVLEGLRLARIIIKQIIPEVQ